MAEKFVADHRRKIRGNKYPQFNNLKLDKIIPKKLMRTGENLRERPDSWDEEEKTKRTGNYARDLLKIPGFW